MILYFLLFFLLVAAVIYDVKKFCIPNWLTFSGLIIGLSGSLFIYGFNGLTSHLWGAAITGGVWLVFWQSGIMGGGDQKLMMAVGALLGKEPALAVIFFTALAGGLQALVWIAAGRRRAALGKRGGWQKTRLPYSIAIAFGTIATVALTILNKLPEWLLWTV